MAMNNREYWLAIDKIKERANCTEEVAIKAHKEHKNIDDAIKAAKSIKSNELYVGGGSSGLAVQAKPDKKTITLYKNGILVEKKFYDFKDKSNLELKEMLQKGEFDAKLLGGKQNESMGVLFSDKQNEVYTESGSTDENKKGNIEKKEKSEGRALNFCKMTDIELPSVLEIDPDGDVKFKVFTGSNNVLVKMDGSKTVKAFLAKMNEYTKEKLVIKNNNQLVSEDDKVSVIKNCLVVLEKKE